MNIPPSAQILNSQILNSTVLVIDTETFPVKHKGRFINEVIQVAGVIISLKDGKIYNECESFVQPTHSIPFNISKTLGITNSMVKNAPKIFELFASNRNVHEPMETGSQTPPHLQSGHCLALFKSSSVIAGHNLGFDIRSIQDSFLLWKKKPPFNWKNFYLVDTLVLSRRMLKEGIILAGNSSSNFSPKLKLKHVASILNIPYNESHLHIALYDAKLTARILHRLLNLLVSKTGISTWKDLDFWLKTKAPLEQQVLGV